jgi:hypothetical protein
MSAILLTYMMKTNTDSISVPQFKRERDGHLLVYLRSNITIHFAVSCLVRTLSNETLLCANFINSGTRTSGVMGTKWKISE